MLESTHPPEPCSATIGEEDVAGSHRFTNIALCVVLACAGCSSEASSPVPGLGVPAASPQAKAPRETLKSTRISVKVQSCVSGESGVATFSAKGTAKGAFPGKFSATGQWSFTSISGANLWTFAEEFKVTGAHGADGTITGGAMSHGPVTCKTFGPAHTNAGLQYHLGTLSGGVTTNLLKNAGSLLEEMH